MSASTSEDGSWLTRLVQSSEGDSSDSTRSHIRVPLRASVSAVGRTVPRAPSNTRSNLRSNSRSNTRGTLPWGTNIHRRIMMYNMRPRRPQLWLPGNRDADDWRRYHGMSSKEYERTKRRISQIIRFAEEDADDEIRSSVVKFGNGNPQVCINLK